MKVLVVGAGLAGSEAAWQLAEMGHHVDLVEMRPLRKSPAHQTGLAAEMVCSNSFKSDDPGSATGILKEEMRRLGSLVLACAEQSRVPAGLSLAVDRAAFSERVTRHLRGHPRIHWINREQQGLSLECPTVLATGPLTSDTLSQWVAEACGGENLHFYDAIAPIVLADTIDEGVAFRASRYGKGEADFLNCPLDEPGYRRFVEALLAAERVPLNDVDTPYFEACLPIEVMADRGPDTLRFGPMKPVGLRDPRTGQRPYAVVQLRQDTLAGDHFNLVGFQTRLRWGAQQEVFRLIPGLEKAAFARYGSIHRNTYVQAPQVLDSTLAHRDRRGLWIAGQLSGVEGYLESAACGLAAAIHVGRFCAGRAPAPLPPETMLGALLHYIANASVEDFRPTNAMLGLLPPLPEGSVRVRKASGPSRKSEHKRAKGEAHRVRALEALEGYLAAIRDTPGALGTDPSGGSGLAPHLNLARPQPR
ncbi:MAG: methylenetetrahydrofolate--tRNA-(uracil(54)-C(5))-methyltransferase (FADH(2)-oxidizing) TrmFO [Acidobacteria bacterium]|nr:methylenetetrahydrofolate--tRNA-(uracil(54)-C(5))-methyltransferase (FADH(2)-oxidizing) TrmFO [Acidobacteriota bacterium]